VAPAARAARAVATTKSKSTLRNAAGEPATLMVVPRAMNTSSTAGKGAGNRAKSTRCTASFRSALIPGISRRSRTWTRR
jgi:hypothetical protein